MSNGLFDLSSVWMAARLELGIDQLSVHCDLVAATIGGNKGEALDSGAELGKECLRQTGGFRQVVSGGTVLDFDAH